jgi:alkaline phosphatase D
MLRKLIISALLLSSLALSAQRINLDPAMRPFYHGVASGDPLSDRVMIWTRLTPDSSMGQAVEVHWQIATDTSFNHVENFGTATARPEHDYALNIDVCRPQPNTWYYYNFMAYGNVSITGRTRTAPVGNNDSARFAVVSCSSYENGYFNAYQAIAGRNDVAALIHLGDYIYEYAPGGYSANIGRTEDPANEIITLSDYRIRHSHYKLDNQLKRAHQVIPFITTWDDHESANNAWMNGAQNHNAGEGPWAARKANSIRAYSEWMPLRLPDPTDTLKIYRKIEFGNLMDILVLDTRLIGRDEQNLGQAGSSSRSLLGSTQFKWLTDNLSDSSSTWKIIAQQVMMAPLQVFGISVNEDQWDGYSYERGQLTDYVVNNNVDNVVVVTGDIHTAWASDIPGPGYNPSSGANSRMVEFVTTSITSPGFPLAVGAGLIQSLNTHIKYTNLTEHGYLVLSVSKTRTQADYYFVNTLSSPNFTENRATSWFTRAGQRHVNSFGAGFARANLNPPLPGIMPNQNLPFALIPERIVDSLPANSNSQFICVIPAPSCPSRGLGILDSSRHGQVTVNGPCIDYRPDTGYIGPDTLRVFSCQFGAPFNCDTTLIILNVKGWTTPQFIDTAMLPDSILTLCWQSDELGSLADSLIINHPPANGTLSVNDSCFSYLPDSGYCGYDTFSLVACTPLRDFACDTLTLRVLIFPEIPEEYWLVRIPFDSGFGACYKFDDLNYPYSNEGLISFSNGTANLANDTCFIYQSTATAPGRDSLIFWACNAGNPPKCDSLKVGIILEERSTTGIDSHPSLAVMGSYPNPFENQFVVQFNLFEAGTVTFKIFDSKGNIIFNRERNYGQGGLQYFRLTGLESLAAGQYLLELNSGQTKIRSTLVKL